MCGGCFAKIGSSSFRVGVPARSPAITQFSCLRAKDKDAEGIVPSVGRVASASCTEVTRLSMIKLLGAAQKRLFNVRVFPFFCGSDEFTAPRITLFHPQIAPP